MYNKIEIYIYKYKYIYNTMQTEIDKLNTPNIIPDYVKNKKRNKLTIAKLYDNMISVSYTLDNGQLNQEKITQQSYSFTKNN
jgi:hypothetical protein